MMSIDITELLLTLTENEIYLKLDGEDLIVNFEKESIDNELVKKIKYNKIELVNYFKKYSSQEEYLLIPSVELASDYAISDAQRRLWVLSQFEGVSASYNMLGQLALDGSYDIDKFILAIESVVDRHEILRTVFKEKSSGEVRQEICTRESIGFKVDYKDFRNTSDPSDSAKGYILHDSYLPFDLENGPLLRVSLLHVSESEYILYFNMHHIIGDGWSMNVLSKDILQYYNSFVTGNTIGLAPLRIQYKDYSNWQLSQLDTEEYQEHKSYWQKMFSGDLPVLNLPSSKTRPIIKNNKGKRIPFFLESNISEGIHSYIDNSGGTLFMFLLASIKTLIHKYTGEGDIIIGSPVAGRIHSDLEDQIGFYVNTLALRNEIRGEDSFNDTYARVKQGVMESFKHQMYPFDRLVEDMDLIRDTSRSALFDVLLTLQNIRTVEKKEEHSDILKGERAVMSKFDLEFTFSEQGKELFLQVVYNSDVYESEMIHGFIAHYENLLSSIVKNPESTISNLDYLSYQERDELLLNFNATEHFYPKQKTLVDLFTEQVNSSPDSIVLVYQDKQYTYLELDELSNQLGHYLLETHGVETGDLIGIKLDRSEWMIVSILAVLKTGGAYVPIDPEYPQERISYILEDASCKVCIDSAELSLFIDRSKEYQKEGLEIELSSSDLAYVIYTSGSTGKPKGVSIENESIVNLIHFYDLKPCNTSLTTKYVFDVSVLEIFTALLSGGKLFLPEIDLIYSPEDYANYLNTNKINHTYLHPMYLLDISNYLNQFDENYLKRILVGVESIKWDTIQWYIENEVQIFNGYGPTEATVFSTYYEVGNNTKIKTKNLNVPIGKPIWNTQMYILDQEMHLVAKGIVGELCIGGDGLARGYLNRPELTQEKFVENPFKEGERIYKTGDLARWLPDGNIEFIGRKDYQVKIRGHRIELGEIENALLEVDKINNAVVISAELEVSNNVLIAYYSSQETIYETANLRESLKRSLPEYMIPHYFIYMESIPLTSNGKIDRKSLPLPTSENQGRVYDYVAPENEKQKMMVEIWEEVLGIDRVGVKDDFFELGGDSIKSIQIVTRLRQKGYTLKVENILQNSLLNDLLPFIKETEIEIDQSAVTGIVPLTPIQKHFFTDKKYIDKNHFNQSVLLESETRIDKDTLIRSLELLVSHHDALRMSYSEKEGEWVQRNEAVSSKSYNVELHDLKEIEDFESEMSRLCNLQQSSLDIEKGDLLNVGIFSSDSKDFILIICHHLVVDGVSWRILLEDFGYIYTSLFTESDVNLSLKTDSFQRWSNSVEEYSTNLELKEELNYWNSLLSSNYKEIIVKKEYTEQSFKVEKKAVSFNLDIDLTKKLQTSINGVYKTDINDVLLTSLGLSLSSVYNTDKVLIDLEGHGREEIISGVDITRTVGWFTSIYPFILDTGNGLDKRSLSLIKVKESLREIPNKGIGYGILKYLGEGLIKEPLSSSIIFNYLGDFGASIQTKTDSEKSFFKYSDGYKGNSISDQNDIVGDKLSISAMIVNGQLQMSVLFNKFFHNQSKIEEFVENYKKELITIIDELSKIDNSYLTPSDLTYKGISYQNLLILNKDNRVEDIYLLSSMQLGLYYHWLSSDTTSAYFLQKSYRLHLPGILISNIEESYKDLIDRHSILRTGFSMDYGELVQIVRKNVSDSFLHKDISGLENTDEKEIIIKSLKKSDVANGFDLSGDSQIRLTLLSLGNDVYEFIWSIHHILMDGWNTSILANEFIKILGSKENDTVVDLLPSVPYSNYISWLENLDQQKMRSYWGNYLQGYNEKAIIPYKNRGEFFEYQLEKERFYIEGELYQNLLNVCKTYKITENTFIQSAWGYLLSKYNNTDDVIFGSVISGRPPEVEGIEDMLGLFINTIPVRVDSSEATTIKSFFEHQQEASILSIPNHYLGLKDIQDQNSLGNDLFDHIIVFENYVIQDLNDNDEIENSVLSGNSFEQTHYDFNVLVNPQKEKMEIRFDYNACAYEPYLIKQISTHFSKVLSYFISEPESSLEGLDYLSVEERDELLLVFNDTEHSYPKQKTLVDLFAEQVNSSPDSIALVYQDKQYTYLELDELSNQLGHYLLETHGIETGDLIGINLDRSEWIIVSILAVLKTGGAYVPIDPEYPDDRVSYVLEDASCKVCIDSTELSLFRDHLKEYQREGLAIELSSSDLAYVIYTSGSTGKPKGCALEHSGVVNRIDWMWEALGFEKGDVVLQKTTFTFDVSVWEIFLPLCWGNKMILCSKEAIYSPEILFSLIKNHKVTTIHFVPSMFSVFIGELDKEQESLSSLKRVITSGESLALSTVSDWYDYSEVPIYNLYGPTEASIDVTWCKIAKEDVLIPIGKPIWNTQMYILDQEMDLVAKGVVGELCIGGDGLARGYLNRPELTQEKFVENPFIAGARIYKTGDLARWLPDGNIEYIGRKDHQVKIRGHRIELGEIENALLEIDKINNAVVISTELEVSDNVLIAYYSSEETIYEVTDLRESLKRNLPEYMIPHYFIHMESIPLTSNGKIDRKLLPLPTGENQGKDHDYVAPENEKQKIMAEIWEEVLGVDRVGMKDDFFELGGHSLKIIRLINKINFKFKKKLQLSAIKGHPTIESLSKFMSGELGDVNRLFSFNKESSEKKNVFLVPPIIGTPLIFESFVKEIEGEWNCYGIEYKGLVIDELPDVSIEKMAETILKNIYLTQATGEFYLLGYSMGVNIVYEIAKKIEENGNKVNIIFVDRPLVSEIFSPLETKTLVNKIFNDFMSGNKIKNEFTEKENNHMKRFIEHNLEILNKHRPVQKVNADIVAFQISRKKSTYKSWGDFTTESYMEVDLIGNHYNIFHNDSNIWKMKEFLNNNWVK